jgi:hypothetical protein
VDGAKAPLLREHNDTVPADDPDDVIDPDDSAPRLSVILDDDVGVYNNIQKLDSGPVSGLSIPPVDATVAAATGAPAMPDLLDPAVLRSMPPQVAAFMLYEPPDPPPWRRQESLGQRTHREQLEDLGGWVG